MMERFFSKTKLALEPRPGMETPCLEWIASRRRDGYGRFRIGGRMEKSNRAAWIIACSSIPDGLHVLHRCDNPACVRIDHLFLGTIADNAHDRDAKGRNVVPLLSIRGEKNGQSKLTKGNIAFIFQLREQGWTQRRIADEFGVSGQQISAILARKYWIDLGGCHVAS
jgi:hypothetical protein